MNKTLNFLFLTVLIAYIHADKVIVNVGSLKGENIFVPQTVNAKVNDKVNIIITFIICLNLQIYNLFIFFSCRLSLVGLAVHIALLNPMHQDLA